MLLSFGTRAMITEKFELNAFATYAAGSTKVKNETPSKTDFVDWSYTVGGIYNFTDMFAAGIKLELETPLRLINFAASSTVEVGSVGTLFARVNF